MCCKMFSRLREWIGNYRVRISHTGLLDELWAFAEIPPEKKEAFLHKLRSLELVKVSELKKVLKEELQLEGLEIERLVSFMKCNGKTEDIREELHRQKCFKNIDK